MLARRFSVLLTVWLVLVWLLVFGRFDLVTVLGGLLVALATQLLFPLPHHRRMWHVRPWHLTVLAARFLSDMMRAGVQVAWVAVSGAAHRDAILRCELRSRDPVYVTVLAAMTSLIPGSIVVQIDAERGYMYLHSFDIDRHGGIEELRRATRNQELRILLAFATRDELDAAGLSRHSRAEQRP